jgi:hypothetical protein
MHLIIIIIIIIIIILLLLLLLILLLLPDFPALDDGAQTILKENQQNLFGRLAGLGRMATTNEIGHKQYDL